MRRSAGRRWKVARWRADALSSPPVLQVRGRVRRLAAALLRRDLTRFPDRLASPPTRVACGEAPWPTTTASSRCHRQAEGRAANCEIGESEASARLDGVCGHQDRRSRGSPHGLRPGDGGTSWRQCQAAGLIQRLPAWAEMRGGRGSACGRAEEGSSQPPHPAPHQQHRWRAERISSPPGRLPPPSRRPPHHPRSGSRSRYLCCQFACVCAMNGCEEVLEHLPVCYV